jgi:hypothetical protein
MPLGSQGVHQAREKTVVVNPSVVTMPRNLYRGENPPGVENIPLAEFLAPARDGQRTKEKSTGSETIKIPTWISKTGGRRQVTMVFPGAGGMYAPNPLLPQALQGIAPPKFSGSRRVKDDWPMFQTDWENYVGLLQQSSPIPVADALLLGILRTVLDETTRLDLQMKLEENPGLTYAQFWAELEKLFGGDITQRNRAVWEALKLENPGNLTSASWRAFYTIFSLWKNRVLDRTEEQEHQLLFRQLPENYQRLILREEVKCFYHH